MGAIPRPGCVCAWNSHIENSQPENSHTQHSHPEHSQPIPAGSASPCPAGSSHPPDTPARVPQERHARVWVLRLHSLPDLGVLRRPERSHGTPRDRPRFSGWLQGWAGPGWGVPAAPGPGPGPSNPREAVVSPPCATEDRDSPGSFYAASRGGTGRGRDSVGRGQCGEEDRLGGGQPWERGQLGEGDSPGRGHPGDGDRPGRRKAGKGTARGRGQPEQGDRPGMGMLGKGTFWKRGCSGKGTSWGRGCSGRGHPRDGGCSDKGTSWGQEQPGEGEPCPAQATATQGHVPQPRCPLLLSPQLPHPRGPPGALTAASCPSRCPAGSLGPALRQLGPHPDPAPQPRTPHPAKVRVGRARGLWGKVIDPGAPVRRPRCGNPPASPGIPPATPSLGGC